MTLIDWKSLHKKRVTPGLPPGTLKSVPDARKSEIRVTAYNRNHVHEFEASSVEAAADELGNWPVCWIEVTGLGDADIVHQMGQIFSLHPLALEDVLNDHQQPKIEEYDGCLFVVARMTSDDGPTANQLSLFLGKDFVLTFSDRPVPHLDALRHRIREGRGRVRKLGTDYLAYCILDVVVDAFFLRLEEISANLETLEERVIASPSPDVVAEIYRVKHQLSTIRRVMSPTRDLLNRALRDEYTLISAEIEPFLRDCQDHTVQILEMVDSFRDLVSGLLDIHLSTVSNRMNEIMKVLTIMATVFIPLGFLAGLYGMNFDAEASPWNMPELKWYWGYPAFLVLLVLVAAGEVAFFWWKGWIGKR